MEKHAGLWLVEGTVHEGSSLKTGAQVHEVVGKQRQFRLQRNSICTAREEDSLRHLLH